jgi:methyl-accepting chemotaxis protein
MRNTSNAHKLYLGFSIGLLLALAIAVWYSFDFVTSLYETSIPINSAIVVVIWGSTCIAMWYIISAYRDITVFDRFTEWCRNPESDGFDIERVESGFMGVVLRPIISSIRENGSVMVSSTSETRSMVEGFEQSVSSRAKLVSFLGGFLVLLGLLGTFLGLTITLQSMGVILSKLAGGLQQASNDSILLVMVELITRLKEPMGGMGTAFSTSLFGLAGSGVVGVLAMILSRVHDQLKWNLENWLSEQVRLSSQDSSDDGLNFPMDGDLSEQMRAIALQLAASKDETNAALADSNKFLLEMTIQQQQVAEIFRTLKELTAETQKGILLGNELTGRLVKDSRQLVSTLQSILQHVEK